MDQRHLTNKKAGHNVTRCDDKNCKKNKTKKTTNSGLPVYYCSIQASEAHLNTVYLHLTKDFLVLPGENLFLILIVMTCNDVHF